MNRMDEMAMVRQQRATGTPARRLSRRTRVAIRVSNPVWSNPAWSNLAWSNPT